MVVVKVLKRKDASSVIVAVVIAMILVPLLASITGDLSYTISGISNNLRSSGWETTYLQPFVWAALQLIALELLGWVYVGLSGMMDDSKKS